MQVDLAERERIFSARIRPCPIGKRVGSGKNSSGTLLDPAFFLISGREQSGSGIQKVIPAHLY